MFLQELKIKRFQKRVLVPAVYRIYRQLHRILGDMGGGGPSYGGVWWNSLGKVNILGIAWLLQDVPGAVAISENYRVFASLALWQ